MLTSDDYKPLIDSAFASAVSQLHLAGFGLFDGSSVRAYMLFTWIAWLDPSPRILSIYWCKQCKLWACEFEPTARLVIVRLQV